MEIFKQEIKDGLLEAISAQNSVAYIAPALVPLKNFNEKSIAELLKRSNLSKAQERDDDLFSLTSVLVTTGWNQNDDFFLPEEVWAARKTPEDKQFNYMHNEKDIIGHITGNYVVDLDGNLLSDDLDYSDLPSQFNIVTNAVIYKTWQSAELQKRINTIIAEIQDGGKWFVSMECLFPKFDYALRDQDGNTKVVAREEATAFLTKHLRAYGGSGQYENYKLGRVLKNLSFSGKGLVTKPANSRSVILKEQSVSENKEKLMELEELKAKLSKAELELAEATKLNEKVKAEEAKRVQDALAQIEQYKQSLAQKESDFASLQQKFEDLSKEFNETKASLTSIQAEKEEAQAKMKDMEKKAKYEKRKAQLAEAGVEDVDMEDTLGSVDSLDDSAFEKVIAVMKKKQKMDKTDKTEAAKASTDTSAEDMLDDAQEKEDKSVASKLNESNNQEDESLKLRSAAAEWFSSCFASVKNKNK